MITPALATSKHDVLMKTTRTWVAQTFYGTMLREMRKSPFKSDLFDGGRGGQAFGAMLDQQLAERMGRGAGGKLAEAIVKRIERRGAAPGETAKVRMTNQ